MSVDGRRWQAPRSAVSSATGAFYLWQSSTHAQECPLIRSAVLGVAALGCLATSGSLRAQALEQRPASAALEASVTLSKVRGETGLFVGGRGLLSTGGRVAIGGAGWLLTTDTSIPTGNPGSDLQLLVAYGGIAAEVAVRAGTTVRLFLRTLVGAGSARVELPVVATEIAADNFAVFEPEAVILRRLRGVLGIGAGLGYRFVFGVEDLPGVLSGDLSGPSASLFLRVGSM